MATTSDPVSSEITALSAVLGTDASKLLDPKVARAWIALLTAYGRVTRALSAELMDSSGMSLADFDVLAIRGLPASHERTCRRGSDFKERAHATH